MSLRRFVTLISFWMAGATFVACADSGQDGDNGSPNPLSPPVACTLIGCEDGLKVEIRPSSGWPAGEYRFQIQADGVEVTCVGSLPLPSCTDSPNVTCDPKGLVQIVESGCALPADSQAFPGLWFDPKLRPNKVAISISRDGQVVGEADIAPSFQRVQPNGPECPPICDVAYAVFDLHF
jgi:hypothetical protein